MPKAKTTYLWKNANKPNFIWLELTQAYKLVTQQFLCHDLKSNKSSLENFRWTRLEVLVSGDPKNAAHNWLLFQRPTSCLIGSPCRESSLQWIAKTLSNRFTYLLLRAYCSFNDCSQTSLLHATIWMFKTLSLHFVGATVEKMWLMDLGRFVFGIGGESLVVVQSTYAVLWFKGKELNLVFGLQLSMATIVSSLAFYACAHSI